MSFDEFKTLVREKFDDGVIAKCWETERFFLARVLPKDATPIVLPNGEKVWMSISCDYLVDKKSKKIEQVPNVGMIPKSFADRIGELSLVYQNKDYLNA